MVLYGTSVATEHNEPFRGIPAQAVSSVWWVLYEAVWINPPKEKVSVWKLHEIQPSGV